MIDKEGVAELIRQLNSRPVSFNPVFARIAGSVTGGLFLSQCFYWDGRGRDSEGWFFKTRDEWQEETMLTRYEQEAARKQLRTLGVLEEKLQGVPATLHYRVNMERLAELLIDPPANKYAEKPPTSLAENPQPDGGNSPNWKAEIPPTINDLSETTQRVQAESTNTSLRDEKTPPAKVNLAAQFANRSQENRDRVLKAQTKAPETPEERISRFLSMPEPDPAKNAFTYYEWLYIGRFKSIPVIPKKEAPKAAMALRELCKAVGPSDFKLRLNRHLSDPNRRRFGGYDWKAVVRFFNDYAGDVRPLSGNNGNGYHKPTYQENLQVSFDAIDQFYERKQGQ